MTIFTNNLDRLLSEAYGEYSNLASKEILDYINNLNSKHWLSKSVLESLIMFFFIFEKELDNKLAIFYSILFISNKNINSFIKKDRIFNMFNNDMVKQIRFLDNYSVFVNNDFNLTINDFNIFNDILEYHRPVMLNGFYVGLSLNSKIGLTSKSILGHKITKETLANSLIELSKRSDSFVSKIIKQEFDNSIKMLTNNFEKIKVE